MMPRTITALVYGTYARNLTRDVRYCHMVPMRRTKMSQTMPMYCERSE
jgi:hypothetical protein